MRKLLDWEDWGARTLSPDEFRKATLGTLWRFQNFISRAKNCLCAGDPPSLIFDGVPLPFVERAANHLASQRFANPEIASAAGEALARGFWQHGSRALAIVRHGKTGWRVRVIAQAGRTK
jgi:hypothetical protein